jgi:DNA gyrase inhibitor GyrI
VCGVSTVNMNLIHGKYGVTEFILSTTNLQVMLMGIFGRWSSERCHTCNEVFLLNQIIIIK